MQVTCLPPPCTDPLPCPSPAAQKDGAGVETSSEAAVELIGANCDEALLNSVVVDWYPAASEGQTVAVGQASGTVTVTGVLGDESVQMSPFGSRRDLTPRAARPCTAVAWNAASPHLLAAGVEKLAAGKDPCLMVWDVTTRTITLSDTRRRVPSAATDSLNWRPKAAPQQAVPARTAGPLELPSSEGVWSLAWIPEHPSLLMAG